MADSLRFRLLAWYAALLVVVIALVGAAVCAVTWRARLGAVDAGLRARANVVAQAVQREAGGAFDVELPAEATAFFQEPHTRPYYAVWDSGGRLIDRSDPDITGTELPPPGPRTAGTNREAVISATGGLTVLVGQDISDVWNEVWSLAATMAVVALIGAAVSLGGAWFLAGRALAPVQRINDTARRMSQGDLTARIAIPRTDTELGQVASALNLAFDRMRESVERQRRFTADASHELRTPVATMMAELEWALLHDRAADDYKESLEVCQRAGGRMQSLVEGLLMLARADSGQLPVRRSEVRLDRLVSDATGLLRPLALQQQVTLRVTSTAQTMAGDPERLRELISSLLYNGISYNRPDGTISVDVGLEHDHVVLRVADTGIGIDAVDLPHVFERFYRGERARERKPSGAGLGLALAKWIVDAHDGTIECTSDVNRGTEFIARFPACATIGAQIIGQLDDERENAMSGNVPE